MGVHDYSCFICSNEGEQSLTNWTEYNTTFTRGDLIVRKPRSDRTDRTGDINGHHSDNSECSDYSDDSEYDNYNNLLCTFPANPGECSQAGQSSCYLYHFRNNPLTTKEPPIRVEKTRYSWDDWGFEKYPSYSDVLTSSNPSGICSVWPHGTSYIVNVCPDCHKYFISDKLDNPPPLLLTTFLCKFLLAPFQPFPEITTLNTNDVDLPIEHLFPLPCSNLRDYIRAFCYHFKLRETPVDFQFRFDDNPLVSILESGNNDPRMIIDYDTLNLNKPGFINGKLYSPISVAIKNNNISQIASLVSRGVKFPRDSYHLLLLNPESRHIIWDNIHLFDRDLVAFFVLGNIALWQAAPKSFFIIDDIKTAISLSKSNDIKTAISLSKTNDGNCGSSDDNNNSNYVDNSELLKYLITLFPDNYQKTKYYTYVCNRDINMLTKLFELGFSPQTHFDHVVNLNWVEGATLCLKYGANLDASAKYHLDRHNKPQMKALF